MSARAGVSPEAQGPQPHVAVGRIQLLVFVGLKSPAARGSPLHRQLTTSLFASPLRPAGESL